MAGLKKSQYIKSIIYQFLNLYDYNKILEFELLYRASRDGHNGNSFHEKVAGYKFTLCFFKTDVNDIIIGGFADKEWQSTGSYVEAKEGFLFSFKTKRKYPLLNKSNRNGYYMNTSVCFYTIIIIFIIVIN